MVNKLFEMQKNLIVEKYKENIAGIAKANSVDLGVAFDMLISNYRCLASGKITEIKPGGGIVDFVELGIDIGQLDKYRRA